MNSKRLKRIIFINIIASITFFFLYTVFLVSGLWTKELFFLASGITLPYIIFTILSYKNNYFFPILPFMLNIIMVCLLIIGNGTVKLTVFFLMPILLAMYYGSPKLNTAVIIFNVLIYFFYPLARSIREAQPMPQLIVLPLIATVPYAVEVLCVVMISQRFLIDSEQIRKENEIYTFNNSKNDNDVINTYKAIARARDLVFGFHIENVRTYTELILNELEKSEEYSKIITEDYKKYVLEGAVLHDIGKINFDSTLLNKFSEWTEEEIKQISTIPQRGFDIIQNLAPGTFNPDEREIIENIVMQHLERLNGSGYPKQLFKRQISLEAQIVAIADCLDSGLNYQPGQEEKTFNTVYMEFITKGYDEYNRDIVNILYEHRGEIIEYSTQCNEKLKSCLG